jgi:hypothetical protein
MNGFILSGWTYSQKLRQCGKDGCKCKNNPEEGHGPYWYKTHEGQIKYVGKSLPADILAALQVREDNYSRLLEEKIYRRAALQDARRELENCINNLKVVEIAIAGGYLSDCEIKDLKDAGIDLYPIF